MTDAAAPATVKTTKKKVSKPKTPADHPKYNEMIRTAIATQKERGGSSRQAILKYIVENYKVASDKANLHMKMAIKAGIKNGTLKQTKGTGASGSFRLGEIKKAAKPKKTTKAGKPAKAKKPKAAAAKKPASEKKAKKPKAKKPKSPKKAAAAKPKKAKSPKKKTPVKPKAKKAAKPKKAAAKK